MSHYLIQICFTSEAFANLVRKPENRLESVVPLVTALGGAFVGSWLSFGEYDSTAVVELPDNISMTAFKMKVLSGGNISRFTLTPLMSFEDGVEAMKLAGDVSYSQFDGDRDT